jgi:hypothetical protein
MNEGKNVESEIEPLEDQDQSLVKNSQTPYPSGDPIFQVI